IPALPALAGIEAENLPPPRRQDRVDLGGRIVRTDDLHDMDRLQQHRLALGEALAHANARRGAERENGGIRAVIGAVGQRHLQVDHGEAERSARQPVDHALFYRADIVAWHGATHHLLVELETLATRQRLDIKDNVVELTVAARLLLVPAALGDRLADGLL